MLDLIGFQEFKYDALVLSFDFKGTRFIITVLVNSKEIDLQINCH